MRINILYNYPIINKNNSEKPLRKKTVSSQPAFKSIENVSNRLYISPALTSEKILANNQEKLKNFTQKNKEALLRVLGKFKHDFDFTDINVFLQNDDNPDCVKLEALLTRIKNEGVFSLYLEPLFKIGKKNANSETDFDEINRFLDFRLKAIENKSLLNKHNFPATVADVDEIVLRNIVAVNKTLKLIGEEALIFSFKEKKDNVLAFIKDLGTSEWDFNIYDSLIKLTNPKSTPGYKSLEAEITRLKAFFPKINEPEKLEQLKKLINTLTREKRNLIENSIKDPKEILEKALIVVALNNNNMKEEANVLLKVLNPKSEEDKKQYNEILNKILFGYYGIKLVNNNILEKLNFQNNKYLPRLFYTKQDFKNEFQKLIQLLMKNPDKTNSEIFNELSKNKQTRLEFENLGINYDKWVSYNPDSKFEYDIDDDNKVVVKKVDLNDIPKALFLGDEADCCTRVNGTFAKCAVSYITSKMIQSIEVYHNDLPIANTMCYFAKINGKPALILDNIEVKPQYFKDDTVKDAIFDYAEHLVKEVGYPDMPIMLSNIRNDIKTANLQSYYYDIDLIGNTQEDAIYLDFITKSMQVDNSTRSVRNIELIRLTENAPKGRKDSDNMKNFVISGNPISTSSWDEYFDFNTVIIERSYDDRYD